MIDKTQAQHHGINTIDSTHTKSTHKNETIEKLKKLIPEIVSSDGQLNTEALKDVIDISHTTANNKGYELTFAGKGIAKAKASSETKYELQVEHKQSKQFDTTGNVVIRGDNIEVLKILKQNYFGKIKMIYIDPPYNTGNDDFIYNNNFKKNEEELIENFGLDENTTNFLHNVYGTKSHSGWLAFMYPRLKLARELLTEDGVIVIAIDHYELNNLTCIADEIFGEENRLGLVSVVHKAEGRNQAKFFAPSNEFMLFYAKNEKKCNFNTVAIDHKVVETFDKEDKYGKYRLNNYLRTGGGDTDLRINKPEFFYPIYVSENLQIISLDKIEGYYEVLPVTNGKQERTWKTKKKLFTKIC